MNVITIPRKIIQNDDLVVIPRKRYEQLVKVEEERENDWLYQEPFKSEVLKRINLVRKQKKSDRLIEWKRK